WGGGGGLGPRAPRPPRVARVALRAWLPALPGGRRRWRARDVARHPGPPAPGQLPSRGPHPRGHGVLPCLPLPGDAERARPLHDRTAATLGSAAAAPGPEAL